MEPTDCICGIPYIHSKPPRVNIGFRTLVLASRTILAAKSVPVRYRHDHGRRRRRCRRIGEKHLKSVCSPGTHRKSCVPLLAPFHMLHPLSRFFLLCLSFVGACEIRRNPRKIVLSLTCETKVSERKKGLEKRSRRNLGVQANYHLLFSDRNIYILGYLLYLIYIFICI